MTQATSRGGEGFEVRRTRNRTQTRWTYYARRVESSSPAWVRVDSPAYHRLLKAGAREVIA